MAFKFCVRMVFSVLKLDFSVWELSFVYCTYGPPYDKVMNFCQLLK